MTQQIADILKYTDRVLDFVELTHGKQGLEKLAATPELFAAFAAEYNEQFIKTTNKVLNLEGEKKDIFFSQLATSVFIQIHINQQNKSLAA